MTDAELDALYRTALGHSHAAAIRAIFDAGVAKGAADIKPAEVLPPSPIWEGRNWERRTNSFPLPREDFNG